MKVSMREVVKAAVVVVLVFTIAACGADWLPDTVDPPVPVGVVTLHAPLSDGTAVVITKLRDAERQWHVSRAFDVPATIPVYLVTVRNVGGEVIRQVLQAGALEAVVLPWPQAGEV